MILADRSMAYGHTNELSVQDISKPYEGYPRATLSIGRLDNVLLFVLKI